MDQNNQKQSIPETLTWKAPAFHEHQRSPGWYLGFFLISLGLLAFAIYYGSVITIITFVLLSFVVFIMSFEPSRKVVYKITKTGITIGNMVYPFKTVRTFWILYNPPDVKMVKFETTAFINNKISMQLGDQDPILVKRVLSQYIPEDLEREESVTETLARRLKI